MSPLVKKNNRIVFSSTQIIIFSAFFSLFMFAFFAFAGDGEFISKTLGDTPFKYKNNVAHLAMKMAETVYGNSFIESIAGLVRIGNEAGAYGALYTMVQDVYNSITVPIGYSLLALYYSLELLEKVQADNFNVEHFIKSTIKLIFGIGILNNLFPLIRSGIAFGDGLLKEIEPHATSAADITILETTLTELSSLSWVKAFPYIVELLIPASMMFLCQVVVSVSLYSRVIELFSRCTFAPIAMPNIFSGGTNSSGFRYFKKIVAVTLQGLIILAILMCSQTLMGVFEEGNSFGESFFGSLKQIIIGFATAMLVLKSQGWANDIMGV